MPKMEINIKEVEKMLDDLNQKGVRKAMAKAINQSSPQVARQAAKLISKTRDAKLKGKDVLRRVKITKAPVASPPKRMAGFVEFSGAPLAFQYFSPRQEIITSAQGRRWGVSLVLGGKRIITGGFHIKRQDGKLKGGVNKGFSRMSMVVTRRSSGDVGFRRVETPSVSSIIRARNLEPQLIAFARQQVAINFRRNFNYYVKGISNRKTA